MRHGAGFSATAAPCFRWSRRISATATVGLFLKGREVAAELEEARAWTGTFDVQLHPSVTDGEARIVQVSRLRHKR